MSVPISCYSLPISQLVFSVASMLIKHCADLFTTALTVYMLTLLINHVGTLILPKPDQKDLQINFFYATMLYNYPSIIYKLGLYLGIRKGKHLKRIKSYNLRKTVNTIKFNCHHVYMVVKSLECLLNGHLNRIKLNILVQDKYLRCFLKEDNFLRNVKNSLDD